MPSGSPFSAADKESLRRRGIPVLEAERQLDLLRHPPAALRLTRACGPGDGVTVLEPSEWADLETEWNRFAPTARLVKFVPASGAATRMFSFASEAAEALRDRAAADLESMAETGAALGALKELVDRLAELPFLPEIEQAARDRGTSLGELRQHPLELLSLLTGSDGLALASRPKGLLPFHRYGDESRTAFEEHVREAALYARGGESVVVHFTVSPEHREAFEAATEAAIRRADAAWPAKYEIEFSTQNPATDTLSLDRDGAPSRTTEGRLLFRPAGHGALLDNLARLEAGAVFVKNIDNVAFSDRHAVTAAWKRRLGGHLLRLRRELFALLDRLETPGDTEAVRDALAFAKHRLALRFVGTPGVTASESLRALLLERLDRPLRVAGVVANAGEPGGGPFWTPAPDGFESGQIVETSQIDRGSAAQVEILENSTHFNPVDLVCSLRDRRGDAYDLDAYVDAAASFVADKNHNGRRIRALERPGLWNGAMAHWNTAFVEVPLETFTPVKTLLDLLRPEHRPAR